MSASTSALHALGQSIWYDNISRQMLENGELAAMIAQGEIRGITSNPSIFRNAIANSHDYDSRSGADGLGRLESESRFMNSSLSKISAPRVIYSRPFTGIRMAGMGMSAWRSVQD